MSAVEPIPVAVVGAGNFGRQHARVYAGLPEANLLAVVDRDLARAQRVAAEYGGKALSDPAALPPEVQAARRAGTPPHPARVGLSLLAQGVDLLVEKPIAPDVESARDLVKAAQEAGRVLQVGHLERFNPAVEQAAEAATLPLFFEIHRMSPFSPRSLDIDVVLDLMIHDLDIVLKLVDSPVRDVSASGLSVISDTTDIANVRIQFENGCVANLTASRVSTEKIRKLRFFQPREYISLDYIKRQGVRIGLDNSAGLRILPLASDDGEPLRRQLESFLRCVRDRSQPRVTGQDALGALQLALRIREAIEAHSHLVTKTLAAHR
ncbi:MAG: Gfo/Idh/MocA family oxidoreductase [Acidobacteriia bacterium]|nr:Gfo/Idh/MocA family oxidoreductase [Terriglobia bacterium]